ncbi:MAG: dockerin type I domain-containing protein [Phycisphaerae bacterium]
MDGARRQSISVFLTIADRRCRRATGFVSALFGTVLVGSVAFAADTSGESKARGADVGQRDVPRAITSARDAESAATAGAERGGCPCNGDLDGDGIVTAVDVAIVTNCAQIGDCSQCLNSCDVNCDGLVDQADIDAVTCQLAAGFPDPACCQTCVEGAPCTTQAECAPGTCIGGFCTCKCSPAGDQDCFTTKCDGSTSIEFGAGSLAAIPAGYFYGGSPAFVGKVELGGPGGFPGDTVITRLEQLCFTGALPETVAIQTEIVALDLRSCAPIDVGGLPFDVHVTLAPGLVSPGDMTVTKKDANGGTFSANLHVEAQATFQPAGGGPDVGPPLPTPIDISTTRDAPWLQVPPPWSCGNGFHPGWAIGPARGVPCCKPTCHANPNDPSHPHCVYPPDCPPCPDPHETVDPTAVVFGASDVPPIPADFFDPGSAPFTGVVQLGGGGGGGGAADTLVARSAPIDCPGSTLPRECAPVSIEIVSLSLRSLAPITVQPGGGTWDVELTLSSTPPMSTGQLQATKTHSGGGIYVAQLPVMPRFTFTRVSNPADVRVLDYANEGLPEVVLDFPPTPWVSRLDPSLSLQAPHDSNFVPGVEEVTPGDPTSQVVVAVTGNSSGGGVGHTVQPPPPPPPPPPPDPHITVDPTTVSFGATDTPTIPADFFGPGSDPFSGDVALHGGGPPEANADVLVQRVRTVAPLPVGASDTIEIELVSLNLRSTSPITVTYGAGGPTELWDLDIELSPLPPPQGTMVITRTHGNGGTFDASLPLQPRFTFTKVDDPTAVRTLDYPSLGLGPVEINLTQVPWVDLLGPDLDGTVAAPSNGNFVPGVDEVVQGDPSSQVVVSASGLSKGGGVTHTVDPPPLICPLPGDPATDPCAPLQTRDCFGTPDALCRPSLVQVQPGGVVPVTCACFIPGPGCGPIDIGPGGDTVSCPGTCQPPDAPGPCVIYLDDGTGVFQNTHKTSASSTQVPPGSILFCDCDRGCQTDADCDDGNPCTTDVCLADGTCQNTPDCTSASDCDDGNACTTDTCDANGCCVFTPECTTDADCDDGNACTTDTCDAAGCCVYTPDCTADTDCNDNNACTTDVCDPATGCCVFTPDCTTNADCDDNNACTTDVCDPASACCTNTPICTTDTDCDDGDVCTTDTCRADGCCDNIPECTADTDCDDGNPCTIDACVAGCCEHTPDPNCTLEACCLFDGTCIDVPPSECTCIYGGIPRGPGTTCATTICPPPVPIWTGMNVDIHQDNPGIVANDFHIEGIIESSAVPVVIDHIDDLFPNFTYSVTQGAPECPTGSIFWCFTADWSGADYPFCSVLHLGLLFEVVCHNVMIDLVGWWTVDGVPVGGGRSIDAAAQPGYWPMLGFDVEDNIVTDPPDPLGQSIRLRNGNGNGTPDPGEIEIEIIALDLVPIGSSGIDGMLGPRPLAELRVGGLQDNLDWVPVVDGTGQPIGVENPVQMMPDDEIMVLLRPAPGNSRAVPPYSTETPIDIPPGGYLVARQLVRFQGNGSAAARGVCPCNGDVNGDGMVTLTDLVIVTDCAQVGNCAMCANSCDVNCDGQVNMGDVGVVQCLLAGNPPNVCCPAGQEIRWFWEIHGAHELPQPEACCFDDGTCQDLLPSDCLCQGGTPLGLGTFCMGDTDLNGIDDACEPQCGPLPDGSGCKHVPCPDTTNCFGECINGSYCDNPDCPIGSAPACYVRNSKESIKRCGDCFGECINGSYCDDPSNPDCCINSGACACYSPNSDISIQLCGDCFGECINGSYCDHPNPDCCITPGACACYSPTHPISIKMCTGPDNPDECLPRCVDYDPLTGTTTVVDCACAGLDECHVGLAGPVGGLRTGHNPCTVVDDGSGTVTLPPIGCEYLSPDEVHEIIDGLPAGTTIELAPIHLDFICQGGADRPCSVPIPPGLCEDVGGDLGGNVDCFMSALQLNMHGTGLLAGFNRNITLGGVAVEVHTAPRTPGDAVQDFDTQMYSMEGMLFGDPDFDQLHIVAGSSFGLPSPGHTTLTRLGPPGGDFQVDSFFDITYRIDFIGAPGSLLDGMSGSTTGTIRMETGGQPSCVGTCPAGTVCEESQMPNPDGTVRICCNCVAEPVGACCVGTVCTVGTLTDCLAQGGTYVGDGTDCADNNGNGVADVCETVTCGPTPDGSACEAVVCPDNGTPIPDECQATCVSYDPKTGVTVFTDCACMGVDDCHVETAGGLARGGGNPCVVPDDAGGTVTLPPAGCEYLSPDEVHEIMNGLPAGTTIELAAIHKDFICREQTPPGAGCPPPGLCEDVGGDLGGNVDCFDSTLELHVMGQGPPLDGFMRTLFLPVQSQVHTGPRTPGDAVQAFETEMFSLAGELPPGDPDFCVLRVSAGRAFGLPSPGHTTLTRIAGPGSDFAVDSFFDITYRIDFEGCPGSVLDGLSGSTTGTLHMETGAAPNCVGTCPEGEQCNETRTVDPVTGVIDLCCSCEPVVINEPQTPSDPVHAARKHRHLSVDVSTNSGGGRDTSALTVGYRVELTSMKRCALDLTRPCTVDSDCDSGATGPCVEHPDVGGVWWVQAHEEQPLGCLPKRCDAWNGAPCTSDADCGGAPGSCSNYCGPTDQFARVDVTPFFSDWSDPRFPLTVLHITDCEITPIATYEIRACLPPGVICSSPLVASTTLQSFLAPGFRGNYGDMVGPVDDITLEFTPPDGFTNVVDLGGYLLTKQNYGTSNKPQAHPTWPDLHGLGEQPAPNGNPPNYILNVADLAVLKKALIGDKWTDDPGNLTPGQCP